MQHKQPLAIEGNDPLDRLAAVVNQVDTSFSYCGARDQTQCAC